MVKNKLKRSLPLLLALVVLISCLTVIPASADEIYWLDGSWQFNYDISWPSDFDFFYPSFVTIVGTSFDAFNYIYSESELWLYNQGDDACAYDSGSWLGSRPVVSFSDRVQVTKDEYDFFQRNLTQTSSPPLIYSTTLTIDGQTFKFTHENAYPEVNLLVTPTGATLTSDMAPESYTYTYSGDGTFQGLSFDASGSTINYPVGSTATIDGGKVTLYAISSTYDPYISVITIGSEQFSFASPTEQPAVTVEVKDTGALLYYGTMSYTYTYSGDGTFQGLSYSATGAASFVPGESYSLAAGSHTLYSISDVSLPNQLTTTVNIYNNAGTQLLYSFKASAALASPKVTVAPSVSSITFTVPDQDPVVFSGVYSNFTGLALRPQAIAPAVALGHTLSIGGTRSDTVLDLYCIYESGFADPSDTDFVGWLATAVGGFLNFELWPGMSLDQVLWVILVIGILMWFLKVIM